MWLISVVQVLARALACPPDPAKRTCPPGIPPNSFYCLFAPPTSAPPLPAQCNVRVSYLCTQLYAGWLFLCAAVCSGIQWLGCLVWHFICSVAYGAFG